MTEQPIEDDMFWRKRLADAKAKGDKDDDRTFESVFYTVPKDWERICKVHEPIVRKETRGLKVLDAGCGYGRTSEWCSDAAQYIGVDKSFSFIEEAGSRYPAENFMAGDLRKLPFDDKQFDIALCISIKHMVEQNLGGNAWRDMAAELKRVAKKVLILEYTTPEELLWL